MRVKNIGIEPSILDKMQKLSQKGESKVIEILTENSKKSKGVDAKMKIQEFFDNKDRVKGLDSWHDQMQLNNKEKETETIVNCAWESPRKRDNKTFSMKGYRYKTNTIDINNESINVNGSLYNYNLSNDKTYNKNQLKEGKLSLQNYKSLQNWGKNNKKIDAKTHENIRASHYRVYNQTQDSFYGSITNS